LYAASDGRLYLAQPSTGAHPLTAVHARLADPITVNTAAAVPLTDLTLPLTPGTYLVRYLLAYQAPFSFSTYLRVGLGLTAGTATVAAIVTTTVNAGGNVRLASVVTALGALSVGDTASDEISPVTVDALVTVTQATNVRLLAASGSDGSDVTILGGAIGWATRTSS
jgi:hypothetical protein